MKNRTLIVPLALLVVAATALHSAPGDWPQWRGPSRTGVSTETGLLKEWPEGGPKLLWTAKGIGNGFASIAITGNRIFTTSDRGGNQHVVCINADDGTEVWGTMIRKGGNGARSTPTLDGDRLYVLGTHGNQEGEIVCLNTKDGSEVWRRDFQKDFKGRMQSAWGYSESPLIDGDNVICTPGGNEATLVALNKKTGETVWKAPVPRGDAAAYASIVIAEIGGVRQYVQLLERGIVGVSAKDGKFLWRYDKVANGTANIPTAIVKDDLIFCSTGYGTGAALLQIVPDNKSGFKAVEKKFLPAKEFQNHHGGMVLVGDYIYAGHGHNKGFPTCIEFKTGKVVWKKEWKEGAGPGDNSAAVVYADGNLYFRFETATMALIEATPQGYKLKGTFKIPGGSQPSWAHPVIAGGKLYLRDQNKMFCYDVKAK
jgi:outer membrane protein assembly factor BamB